MPSSLQGSADSDVFGMFPEKLRRKVVRSVAQTASKTLQNVCAWTAGAREPQSDLCVDTKTPPGEGGARSIHIWQCGCGETAAQRGSRKTSRTYRALRGKAGIRDSGTPAKRNPPKRVRPAYFPLKISFKISYFPSCTIFSVRIISARSRNTALTSSSFPPASAISIAISMSRSASLFPRM